MRILAVLLMAWMLVGAGCALLRTKAPVVQGSADGNIATAEATAKADLKQEAAPDSNSMMGALLSPQVLVTLTPNIMPWLCIAWCAWCFRPERNWRKKR